jgi:hypothetical protein
MTPQPHDHDDGKHQAQALQAFLRALSEDGMSAARSLRGTKPVSARMALSKELTPAA